MTPRTKAFNAWFRAFVNSGLDLGPTRTARAEFEAIAGKQDLGEMCGDFVHVLPEGKPGPEPKYEALVPLPPVKFGKHHVVKPGIERPIVSRQITDEKRAVGERIANARLQAGHSLIKTAATVIGIPSTTLAQIENGRMRLTNANAVKIAAALGVSAEWLKTGQGQPFAQAA